MTLLTIILVALGAAFIWVLALYVVGVVGSLVVNKIIKRFERREK